MEVFLLMIVYTINPLLILTKKSYSFNYLKKKKNS